MEDASGSGVCSREMAWVPVMSWPMRGLEPFYRPLTLGWRWPLAASLWVRLARTSLGLRGGRTGARSGASDLLRLLWVRRSSRKVDNFDGMLPAMKNMKGYVVEVLDSFSHDRTALITLLSVLQKANVLAGVHGVGLAHALYMSEGSALLEFKGSYAYDLVLFFNVAILRGMWFYAVDVRDHERPNQNFDFPPDLLVQTFQRLRVDLANRTNYSIDVHCDPTWNYKRFLQRLPHLGAVGPPANDDCGRAARAMEEVVSMTSQASHVGGSIQALCKAVQGGDVQSILVDIPATPVIKLRGEEVDRDSTGNHVPAIFLPYAVAVLANVDILKFWPVPFNASSLHDTFFGTLQGKMFRPAIDAPTAWNLHVGPQLGGLAWLAQSWYKLVGAPTATSPAQRLKVAAETVCRCTASYLHLCRAAEVWAAFQAFWRPRFRESLLEIMQPGGVRPIDAVGAEVADLVVHVRCGDILKYNMVEYGYLGISAWKKALEDRQVPGSVRIRILTNPFAGADLPPGRLDKDMPKAQFCFDFLLQLSRLVEEQLVPAKVVVDNTSETIVGWAHMALGQRTLCNPSTYCLWPTLAATRGFLADTPLFFSGSHPELTGMTHLVGFPYLSTREIFDRKLSPQQIVDWIRLH